jgi:hypothetical protein
MGAVYEALHVRLKKRVAVKVLPAARVHDPEAVARFRREMEALGALAHPNVVGATDAGEEAGFQFLVMEYVDGVDLSNLVRLCGPLSVADAAEVIRQAAVGLQYIHENGRVHRDIKPSNLMLSAAGEVKILDLGLALLRAARGAEDELTASGQAMGTADYMAPEQWDDSHAVDIRADIYSLGCTLFKLLTGKAPFADRSGGSAAPKRALHATAPVPPLDARPDVPEPLRAALARMLAKAPEERFAAPAEVAEAVRPFTGDCDPRRLAAEARSKTGPPHAALIASTPVKTLTAPAPPRRRVGRRVLAYAALAGAALAATALGVLFFRSQYPPPHRDGAGITPTALIWPEPRNSDWSWDPARSELKLMCDKEGLIRLADAPGDDYEFSVDLYEAHWGSAGVFFGHHEEQRDGKPVEKYQLIELQRFPRGQGEVYRLALTAITGLPGGGGGAGDPARAAIPNPFPEDQHLSVVVEGGVLRRVVWNRADYLPEMLASPAKGPTPPPSGADCRGGLGVYCVHNTVVFRNPRIVPRSPP